MITNPKIERKKADIARTETRLAEVRTRLKQQKEELVKLEDDEIVALFRKEIISEDDFTALLRSRREEANASEASEVETLQLRKEETPDAISEN